MTTSNISHFYVGCFLVTPDNSILGQQRDDKPDIDNPNRVGSFGGTIEHGESMISAITRELREETNLNLAESNFEQYFQDTAWRKLSSEWEQRYFYFARITEQQYANLQVYEGQGWVAITSSNDPLLIDLWRQPYQELANKLAL